MRPGRQPQDRLSRRVGPAPWGDGGGCGESRCRQKLETWSQAELESTRLLKRAGGGLRGPGRPAEGIEKECREKTHWEASCSCF